MNFACKRCGCMQIFTYAPPSQCRGNCFPYIIIIGEKSVHINYSSIYPPLICWLEIRQLNKLVPLFLSELMIYRILDNFYVNKIDYDLFPSAKELAIMR